MKFTTLILWIVGFCLFAAAAAAETKKYLRFAQDGKSAYGALVGDTIFELSGPPFAAHKRTGRKFKLSDVSLLPPTEPSKVIAVALNYASHAGSGTARPELFAKLPSSLVGHRGAVVVPPEATGLHFEGELVVVIGRKARHIKERDVPGYIFGVTVGNDISDRGWQGSDMQWLRAKASDGFGPVGPVIVTGLDTRDLLIETRVNGEIQQSESTKNLIHGVNKIVAYASRYFTLLPGDLIFTGTPGRTRAMKPGDVVEVRIQGIGTLRNKIVRHDESH